MSDDDGSNGSWYDILLTVGEGRDLVIETQDLVESLGLNFAMGNILKSVARMGKKPGSDESRDLRKIIYYAQRELDRRESGDLAPIMSEDPR